MRRFCNIPSAPFLLMLVLSALSHHAQAQKRFRDWITQPIESANKCGVSGSLHPLAKAEFDAGLTDNAKVLQGMTINFKRSEAQEASLQASAGGTAGSVFSELPQVADAGAVWTAVWHERGSCLAQVQAWLQQEGFTVTSVAQSSNAISFSGSVASVEKAFQTANTQLQRAWRSPFRQFHSGHASGCAWRPGEQRARSGQLHVEAENQQAQVYRGKRRR